MTTGDPAERPKNGSNREARREKARQLRETHRKQERRRAAAVWSSVAVVVAAIAAIVAVVLVTSIHPGEKGPANMASDGIVIGKGLKAELSSATAAQAKPVASVPDNTNGSVTIVTYVDYLCPYCGEFERTNASQIGKLVDSGAATVEIHPIPLLTSHSAGTKYSLRATNAAACVANDDPNAFWSFNRELFDHQPEENTVGLTDQQIKDLAKKAGVGDFDAVSTCIDDGRFDDWATASLQRALNGPIPNSGIKALKGTPLVLVNGQQYQGSLNDADEFRAFIVKAQADTYSTATPTPSATATAGGTSTPAATSSSTPTPTSTK
jgi:protein-disulfide isomerase